MSLQGASLLGFDFLEALPIQIELSDAPLTSDAGLLPLRQFDERIGLTQQIAAHAKYNAGRALRTSACDIQPAQIVTTLATSPVSNQIFICDARFSGMIRCHRCHVTAIRKKRATCLFKVTLLEGGSSPWNLFHGFL